MVRGYCRSNDDHLREFKWPEVFACVPSVGDRVQSTDKRRSAKVASIMHYSVTDVTNMCEEPRICVEIYQFQSTHPHHYKHSVWDASDNTSLE